MFCGKGPPPRASNDAVTPMTTGLPPTTDAAPVVADDAALLSRVAAGDKAAFEAVVGRYAPQVTRLASRLLGWSNAADVDDLVQDVFARVWERAGTFRADARAATWVTAITLNACRAWRRRAWVRKVAFGRLVARHRDATSPSADVEAQRDETADRVRAAVRQLRPIDREVIVLHYLEGHAPADVAKLLNVTPNAVDVRLHRARARLKQLLERDPDSRP